MKDEEERLEEMRSQLEAFRVHARSVPMQELESFVEMQVGHEPGCLQSQISEEIDRQPAPVREPLREAAGEIDRWLKPGGPGV